MGQAMATLIWRWLGRDAARKPLLCDHHRNDGDHQETGAGYFLFGRYWEMLRALFRRLLMGNNNNPTSDPPPSLRYDAYTPSAPQHCIDIGVVGDHIPQQPRSENNDIGIARDDLVEQLAPPARVDPPISRRSWGALGPYSWEHKILLVGEGDFSFSTSLAIAFGDASNMIATSLDSFDFLMQHYKRAVINILELTSKNCKVMHGVDATKMANHPHLNTIKFDRIVYNFPHAGFLNRHESREAQICSHTELVRGFLANAKKMIKDDGQIHITHKCVGFFLEWNIERLGSRHGLRLVEESPFNLPDYPGYNTKFGYGGDANFDWKPAKTYKFELAKKKQVIGGGLAEQPKKLGSYMYIADQSMLLVGEGDFSFAASLAAAFGDASRLVATSLDSLEFLKKNYKKAERNMLTLTSRGCKVMHGVNATTMATKHPELVSLKFSCIVFNFPLAVFSDGKPPRNAQLSKHQELISAFLANAKQMIRDDGQIHITHACFGWYAKWNVATLGSSEGLQLVEESPFSSKDYPGYCSKLGCGGDHSFGCNPALTYKFQLPNNNVPKN